MNIKKTDFAIIIMLITAVILALDNLYFDNIIFKIGDIHHESFIIALVFASIVLYLLVRRKK